MTANVFLLRETCIEQKSIVFHMGYVADIVKSKEVIKLRIIKVFGDFGVSVQDLKEKVTLTTDRYGILKLCLLARILMLIFSKFQRSERKNRQ